jgi:drug/metabolite transporter (DMT)-like permease
MQAFGFQEIVAISGTIALNSLAQIFLRMGLKDVELSELVAERNFGSLFSTITSLPVLAGIGCFIVGLVFWFLAISRLPASIAYPMVSIGYVLVVFLGWTVLNEPIGWQKLTGSTAIIVGVVIISRAT